MNVTGGSIDVTTYFALRLTATGVEATGLDVTTFDLQYVRSGAAPSTKADATALVATDSAHADNKAIEIDATDQPGLYRVDWPDAAFAAGVKEVILTVKAATVFTEHLRVSIDAPVNVTSLSSDQQSLTDLKDFADAGYDPATNKVQGVVLTDTLTTYTGNTPQTGDSYARLGANGGGLTALGDTRIANLDATISSRLASAGYTAPDNSTITAINAKTTNLPAAPAATGDIPTAAQNATGLLDLANGIETGFTPRQALRLILSALAGILDGAATSTIAIRDVNNSKTRISATVDADGNRTAVTLDAT